MATAVKIRTVTYFTSLKPDNALFEAPRFLNTARERFTDAGFTLQTARLSAATALDDLPQWRLLDEEMGDKGFILNALPLTNASTIDCLPSLVRETQNVFWNFALGEDVQREQLLRLAAVILQIASESGVDGSFRFCVSSQCPPYIPYFPASYGLPTDAPSFAVGLESSGILRKLNVSPVKSLTLENSLWILQRIEALCKEIEAETGVLYRHIDTSLCPSPLEPPMTDFWRQLGLNSFGDPGTLSVCSSITRALKSILVEKGGYCGLMLPVCEDSGLMKSANQGAFKISDLLYYSTVCSCGLDCVPIPGYTSDPIENSKLESRIAHYLNDMHSIATKLKKPLACRLLPVPGKVAGERTNFNFPHLINGNVMEL